MKKIFAFLILAPLLITCSNDDADSGPKPMFTFTVGDDAGYVAEAWIVLRDDATGDLIEARQIEKGKEEVFEASNALTTDKLTVTFFYTLTDIGDSRRQKRAQVYRGIDAGSKWTAAPQIAPAKTPDGSFKLSIEDAPQDRIATVSTEYGTTETVVPGLVQEVSVYPNSSGKDLVVLDDLFDQSVAPRYTWLTGVAKDKEATVSFEDFKAFDKVVTIMFPRNYIYYIGVYAIDDPSDRTLGYALREWLLPDIRTKIDIGYLNEFDNYDTYINIEGFSYSSRGPAPDRIQYVGSYGYTVEKSNDIGKFSITTTNPYVYATTSTGVINETTDLQINYYAPSGTTKYYDPLTPEIISKYSIDLSKVKYTSTSFMVSGNSYADFIDRSYNRDYDLTKPFEETFVDESR